MEYDPEYRIVFKETTAEAAKNAWMGEPDEVKIDDDGGEIWYYRVALGGRDTEGVYQLVLEGPAEGEKAYVRQYTDDDYTD